MSHRGPIDLAFVQRIIDSALPEDQELEYKRDRPKTINDPEVLKKVKTDPFEEFAKDVAAMANASGGVLLYGVAEDPQSKKPLLAPINEEPYDHVHVQLQGVLDSLIEPRLMGVQFYKVPVDRGYVLGLVVPGSFAGPHWNGKPGRRRFSIRRGAQVSEYTYQELRAAFDRNASAATNARKWITDRLAGIKSGKTWRPLMPGPITVVHAVPLVSYYQESTAVDLNQASQLGEKFPRPWQSGYSDSLNFDGYMIYQSGGEEDHELFGYTQLFRNGSIEVVMSASTSWSTPTSEDAVGQGPVAWVVHDSIVQAPPLIQALGKEGPLLIGVAVMGASGCCMAARGRADHRRHVADRDDLIVPVAYVEHAYDTDELNRIAHTALDMIWQGFGYRSCPFYDQNGAYRETL